MRRHASPVRSAFLWILALFALTPLPGTGQTEVTGTTSFEGYLGVDPERTDEIYRQTMGQDGLLNEYRLAIPSNREIRFELTSEDFDTYLIVITPSGERIENDDVSGTDSGLSAFDTQDGEWVVQVRAFDGESTGSYTLGIRLGPEGSVQPFSGMLTSSSPRTPKGAWYDSLEVPVEMGRPLRISVTGGVEFSEFGLALETPSGRRALQRFSDGTGRTELGFVPDEGGTHTLFVFSEFPIETESEPYSGFIFTGEEGATSEGEVVLDESGALTSDDAQMVTGEYYRSYDVPLQGVGGLRFELSADDFDTFLVVESPTGARYSNDDAELGGVTWASICEIAVSPEDVEGTWTVYVTSYSEGEVGAFRLMVRRLESAPFGPEGCGPF